MLLTSPGTIRAIKGSINLKYLFVAIRNAITFLKIDALEIIKEIPKDKLIIIKGEKDKYFCDSESVKVLMNSKIPFFELKGVGHYWVPEVDEYIKQFIK